MAKPGRWELTRVHREHKDKFFKEKKKRNQRDVEREIRGKTEQGDGGSGEDAGRGRQAARGGEAGAGGAVWRVPIASLHRGSPTSSSFSLRLE